MATFVKFNSLPTAVAAGTHAAIINSASGTIRVALTNSAPSVTGDSLLAHVTGVLASGNGYAAADITNTATTSAGTITLGATDVTWTASGGPIGPARYAFIYNDTATGDPLIGYWDRGSSVTATAGDSITVDFGTSVLTLS